MTIRLKAAPALAIAGSLALAACGDKAADEDAKSSVTMNAVEVPEGTISDSLMPLDTYDGSDASDNSQAVAAPGIGGNEGDKATPDNQADGDKAVPANEDDSVQ
ncbi:MAG: hypothetical protein GW859_05160 [Sphingomonadales bacterium]|nr:hypothetical protein [Sphingomonadales bacterium]